RPMGSVKGRLLDPEGNPLAEIVVNVSYRDPWAYEVDENIHSSKQTVTDAAGAFELNELVPELKFHLSFHRRKRRFAPAPKPADPSIQVKFGECRDLGAIRLKMISEESDD